MNAVNEGVWTMTESEFNAELAKAWEEGQRKEALVNIPNEAVEAAAKVLVWDESHGLYTYRPEGHQKRDASDRYADKRARAALQAAAASIWSDALEAAAAAIDENPYADLDPFYAGWLRDRARKMRESE
jgi:hypothetical protein